MRQALPPKITLYCHKGWRECLRAVRCIFSQTLRALTVIVLLVGIVIATGPDEKPLGDRLQMALPIAGLGCAIANGHAPEYVARFAAMLVTAHSLKAALGALPINQRPNGNGAGFPSAHSAAAAFGATALVRDCFAQNPALQAIALLTAGYVGTSRITANAHSGLQVLCGWALGAGMSTIARRRSASRRRLRIALRSVARHGVARWLRKLTARFPLPSAA